MSFIGAFSVHHGPEIFEVLLAVPLSVIASTATVAFLKDRIDERSRWDLGLILAAAWLLPMILAARYLAETTVTTIEDAADLTNAGVPLWLLGWLLVCGFVWAGTRVLALSADTRGSRKRLRRVGRIAFWALWPVFWIWALAEVAGPTDLLSDPRGLLLLVLMGLLAWLDALIAPRLEDRLAPAQSPA